MSIAEDANVSANQPIASAPPIGAIGFEQPARTSLQAPSCN